MALTATRGRLVCRNGARKVHLHTFAPQRLRHPVPLDDRQAE
jgi:hypothetical protein